MTRADNVVDADGHILEPLNLCDDYIDPAFRERRPRFVIDDNGKERLTGEVTIDSLKYADGRKVGSICAPASSRRLVTTIGYPVLRSTT
jgi:hypothetical protein